MSIVDARGREVRRATIEHNAAGLRELLELLSRAGAREVAIERPDGPVVDTLLEAGITVVVISPNQLKNLRGRYGSAGNKDDRVIRVLSYACILREEFKQRPGVQHSRIECVDLHAIAVNPKIHTMLRVPFCCSTQ